MVKTYRIDKDLSGKVALVTGANAGLGRECTKALYRAGAEIYMACRSVERCKAAMERVKTEVPDGKGSLHFIKLDMFDQDSVRECAKEFMDKDRPLNFLFNNAGLVANESRVTKEGFEETFAVNHLGSFLLTMILLDKLKATPNARIITVSSIGHHHVKSNIDYELLKKPVGGSFTNKFYAYAVSKLCNIMFTAELSRRLKEEGSSVTAYCLHPGAVATEIWRNSKILTWIANWFMLSEEQGAFTSLYCATSSDLDDGSLSGKYFDNCQVKEPSKCAQDTEEAKKMFEKSKEFCGLK